MKRTVAVLISLLLIIGMLPAASFADEGLKTPTYIESVYNEENGLPTGEANAIVQDASGYLWIGSYGGPS